MLVGQVRVLVVVVVVVTNTLQPSLSLKYGALKVSMVVVCKTSLGVEGEFLVYLHRTITNDDLCLDNVVKLPCVLSQCHHHCIPTQDTQLL